jgi:lipid II:glycine glycyltransferase (peptidoglycan interpeptide bridge formation enzyme)
MRTGRSRRRPIIERGVGAVFGAFDEGRVVAAIFVSYVGDEAEYVYGGFLAEAAKSFPNHVLQHAAIERGIELGMETYNLGNLRGGSQPSGVDAFKRSVGGVPRPRPESIEWMLRPVAGAILERAKTSSRGRDLLRRARAAVVSRATR